VIRRIFEIRQSVQFIVKVRYPRAFLSQSVDPQTYSPFWFISVVIVPLFILW